jgi:uncharacterized protein (TIGR02246 family)
MKKNKYKLLFILISLSAFLSISEAAYTQKISEPDKYSILQVLQTQQDNWNKGNLEGYMDGYLHSDSLKFITVKGITYGWNNTLQKYKKAYPDQASMGMLKFDVISVELICDEKAIMNGKWTLTYPETNTNRKPTGGYFTLIWQKIEGKWLIITDHTS